MPAQILHMHIYGKPIRRRIHPRNGHFCRLRLQKLGRALRRRVHLLGLRLRRQFIAMILQHPFHDEIRSDKHVAMHALAWRAVQRRHRDSLGHRRHMAVLAGLRGRVVAMLPLLERHLLRELRQLLTLRPSAAVNSVWQLPQRPASRIWSPLAGKYVAVEECITVWCPLSMSKGPYSGRRSFWTGFAITTFPTKVASVPSPVFSIWWQTEQVTPSAAARSPWGNFCNGRREKT